MIIYGNEINIDIKEYLAKGHLISELTDSVENAGLDVILTPLKAYAGLICRSGYSLESGSYAEVMTQFNNLCEELPYALAGTKGMWVIEEEDIIL